ncbi:MAG: PAS domain S-box protein [Anaerolineaceae bacterium]|nr:PAS domain S-box protein [Anaerolineaceae bacterium]
MSENQPSPDNDARFTDEITNASKHLSQQRAVIQITQNALLSSNLFQLMVETIELVRTILSVDFGEILEVNRDQNSVTLKAIAGWPVELQQTIQTVRELKPGSLYEYVLSSQQPVVSSDLIIEERFKLPEIYHQPVVHSCLCAVIQSKDQPYGILAVFSSTPRIFSSIEINFIQKIANLLALVIDHRRVKSSLVTSQGELAVILEGISEGITVQVAGGKLVYANDIAARLLGYKDRKELLSVPIGEVLSGIEIYSENGEIMPTDQFQGRRVLQGEDKVSGINRILNNKTGIEQWWLVNSAAIIDTFKQERMAVNIFQDITAIKQKESDQKFLAAFSDLMARSVTYEQVLKNVADMAIQHLADWCLVHTVEDDGEIRQLTVAHKDPQKIALTQELQCKYPPHRSSDKGIFKVIQTGEGEFYPDITDAMLRSSAQDEEHYRLLSNLGLHAAMVLPMLARGHSLGTITLIWAESRLKYTDRELYLGQEMAQRAALAMDNVRLYQQARTLNEELEYKVLKRTAQLERINAKLEAEIAERKQVQQDLETSKALFSDLFELSPDAIFLVEHSGKILRINDQAAAIFGYQKRELLGKDIEQLLPDYAKNIHIEHRKNYHADPQRRVMGAGFELLGRFKTGEQFPVDVMLSPVKIGDDWLVISVVRDISEQKRTQAELAEVQHRLLDSQETERLMLAQELHDGTIQELFSINFQLVEFGSDVNQAGMLDLGEKIKGASEAIQNVIQGLRNISRDLRPPALAPFGLEQAIYSHLERFNELHPEIEIHTDISPDGQRLEERIRLVMFRIYQNAVSNVARHAETEKLWVRFDLTDQWVTLEVEDNGKGFNIPGRWVELVRQGHLGLVGIRERVEAIGGKLTIVSSPGKGTLIRVAVPLGSS